jgi:nucleoside-diphosphate-sugar epimerase
MPKKRVILTGSTGLVGKAVTQVLKDKFDLYLLVRDNFKELQDFGKTIPIALDNESVTNIFNEINPDYIVHCAARIPSKKTQDSKDVFDYNWLIDQNIFNALQGLNTKLIYISTTSVYSEFKANDPLTELSPVGNESYYAQEKIRAENHILDRLPDSWIFRINAPYGPDYRIKTVLHLFIEAALNSKEIFLHGSGNRRQDFTHVIDIATLIENILFGGNNNYGIYNISSGNPISMYELACKIIKLASSNSEIKLSGLKDPQEGYLALFSSEKAKKYLSWNPEISLDRGILELIQDAR